jgi:hypothetical protein
VVLVRARRRLIAVSEIPLAETAVEAGSYATASEVLTWIAGGEQARDAITTRAAAGPTFGELAAQRVQTRQPFPPPGGLARELGNPFDRLVALTA